MSFEFVTQGCLSSKREGNCNNNNNNNNNNNKRRRMGHEFEGKGNGPIHHSVPTSVTVDIMATKDTHKVCWLTERNSMDNNLMSQVSRIEKLCLVNV